MYGPKTEMSNVLHSMKYRIPGENFEECMNRIAFAQQDDDRHYHAYRDALLNMRFMPAGRVQNAMGATRQTTPYNCYVSGTIEDSYVDGPGSIMQRAHEAAATLRMGGGIGYDFSTLRPRGDQARRIQATATGPVSFMSIYNSIGYCANSSGERSGAQMAVLRVDHPDIEEFIKCKQNTDQLQKFNISVGVTDEFMMAVLENREFDLRFNGTVYRTIEATALWESMMRSTYDWSEPGVLFIDRINDMNNLKYVETIAATNPCGEQPLPPFGACLLGSFNLPAYTTQGYFDWGQLQEDIPNVVRAMDNVVDRARYPLPQQKAEAICKRRMGLGVTGLANASEAMGSVYGSPDFLSFEDRVLAFITHHCYRASALLAKERGPFPLYDEEKYLDGLFIRGLAPEVKHLIRMHGIRNSHLISIAPTGTISLCADNVSSGLEPVFQYSADRLMQTTDGPKIVRVEDYGVKFLGVKGKLAHDVTVDEHVSVLATAQKHVDSAVSKTINLDSAKMSWAQFKGVYETAWKTGCKGCTTYNASGKRGSIFKKPEPDEPEVMTEALVGLSCEIDPASGRRNCE